MKKIISIITVIAVIMTMFAVVPASAAVYVKVTSHHANATANGGLYYKEANEYAVAMTSGGDTKAVVNFGGAATPYKFADSKYVVIDMNVAPTDDATQLSAGPNAGIFNIYNIKSFNKNRWNNVRLLVESKSKEDLIASGKYQPMTMYVNGVLAASGATSIHENDELSGVSGKTATYGQAFRFSVHGSEKEKTMAYVADIRISESDTAEAPVMPSLVNSDKYDIYPTGIVLKEDMTIGELEATAGTIKVFNGDAQITDASAKIANGNTILVVDNTNKLYSYYDVEYKPTANQWTDDMGNIYTWHFSPITKTLTIGMVEKPVVAPDSTYGAILTESWAGAIAKRPWDIHRDVIEHINFKEAGGYHFLCFGRQMFDSFSKIKEVTIPRYVIDSQWGVFKNCKALETVTFEEGSHGMEGGITTLKGMKMFDGCTSLKTLNLSTGTTSVGASQMFIGCTSLKEVFLPAHITVMAADAFNNCGAVKLVTYENSKTHDRLKATNFTNTEVTVETIPPTGYIEDLQGNANSIKWTIDTQTKTLTISDVKEVGTGDMPDKAGDNYQGQFPWNGIAGYNKIVVEEGITRTGRWFCQNPKSGALEYVSLPGTLTDASVFSFVSSKVDKVIINEGAKGMFATGQVLNRDMNIANLYLPSTANNIHKDFWRALDESSKELFVGTNAVNIYAPLGSEAYKWASDRAANPAQDADNGGKDVAITVIENITVDSLGDEGVVVANNSYSAQTADIIVAYFDGDTFKDAVLMKNAQLGADSTVTVPAPKSAEGYTREVFVWNNTSSLTPVAINAAE